MDIYINLKINCIISSFMKSYKYVSIINLIKFIKPIKSYMIFSTSRIKELLFLINFKIFSKINIKMFYSVYQCLMI
jgi:hypothetical protein